MRFKVGDILVKKSAMNKASPCLVKVHRTSSGKRCKKEHICTMLHNKSKELLITNKSERNWVNVMENPEAMQKFAELLI